MNELSFEGFVLAYLSSIKAAFSRITVAPSQKVCEILRAVTRLSPEDESRLLREVISEIAFSDFNHVSHPIAGFVDGVSRLLSMTDQLVKDEIPLKTLETAASLMHNIGVEVEMFGGCEDIAYNLFESSYIVSHLIKRPCLETAGALRRLSDPRNIDEHHSAIWRCATEMVRHAILTSVGWRDALDAAELALMVYATNREFQQQLCDSFLDVLRSAEGTPLDVLLRIYPIQVRREFIEPSLRSRCAEVLTGLQAPPMDNPSAVALFELVASANAQCAIDDRRQDLQGRSRQLPNIRLADLALHHANLFNAVPLQQSLIVDIARTGEFVMQLVHEIAHAYCLVGSLGFIASASRAISHFWEAILHTQECEIEEQKCAAESSSTPHEDLLFQAIAKIQLAAVLKSATCEGAWMPWLEGVAMYIELLADPSDNSHEIVAVHKAVRSLIDPKEDSKDSPGSDKSPKAALFRMVEEFDDFLSRAIKRLSRLRHVGYTNPELGSSRDIYILGYLLVRAVISAWESTLGKRILPVDAAKLLLELSRITTWSINWGFKINPAEYQSQAMTEFRKWVEFIAGLPIESLEMLLENVDRDSKGHCHFWDGERVVRYTGDNSKEAEESFTRIWRSMSTDACIFAKGNTLNILEETQRYAVAKLVDQNREGLIDVIYDFTKDKGLLPVGRDMARLILTEDGRAVVCPRTYIGLESSKGPVDSPRYSTRSFALEGGSEEAEQLRRTCGVLGTSRILVTRIVDLVGHPASPRQQPNLSYVCMLHGDWHRISVGDNLSPIDVSTEFLQAITRRIDETSEPKEEALGSLHFLADRLEQIQPNCPMVLLARSFDKGQVALETALEVLSHAWNVDIPTLRKDVSMALAQRTRIHLADYLYTTGIGDIPDNDHPIRDSQLASIAFHTDYFSGIRPLKGKRNE